MLSAYSDSMRRSSDTEVAVTMARATRRSSATVVAPRGAAFTAARGLALRAFAFFELVFVVAMGSSRCSDPAGGPEQSRQANRYNGNVAWNAIAARRAAGRLRVYSP